MALVWHFPKYLYKRHLDIWRGGKLECVMGLIFSKNVILREEKVSWIGLKKCHFPLWEPFFGHFTCGEVHSIDKHQIWLIVIGTYWDVTDGFILTRSYLTPNKQLWNSKNTLISCLRFPLFLWWPSVLHFHRIPAKLWMRIQCTI